MAGRWPSLYRYLIKLRYIILVILQSTIDEGKSLDPILDRIMSVLFCVSVMLEHRSPLDYEMGLTGDFWSKTNLLK